MSARVILTVSWLVALAGPASAGPRRYGTSIEPVRGCAGRLVIDATTGASRWSRIDETSALRVIYNSFTAPTNFGITGPDNDVVWGDSVLLDRSGTLEEITLSLYNAYTTYASLDSASLAVQIEDPASSTLLGSWTLRADLVPYGGLPNGYYVLLSIAGLSAHPVAVGGWVVVKQRLLSSPGFPSGLGVSSFTPPGVGSSPPSMYSSESGFFTIPGNPADVGYRLVAEVVDAAEPVSWGRLKRLYR